MRGVPHVLQGWGPDGTKHIGMATNKSMREWNTKSTAGRPLEEVPILSVYVNDIRTVKYIIETKKKKKNIFFWFLQFFSGILTFPFSGILLHQFQMYFSMYLHFQAAIYRSRNGH